MLQKLKGKVAIVTGAGRGIGRAEAIGLAKAGAKVIVNDLGAQLNGAGSDNLPAAQVVEEIRADGGEAVVNYGDVSKMETGAQLVEQALEVFGRLDILVNNAGIARPGAFSQLSEADWDAVIAVHLRGHFTVTHAAVQHFIKQQSGRIINTSSEGGLGAPMFSSYATAKEGITGLTRTLAQELNHYNITVNQIRPRSRDTRMSVLAHDMGGAQLSESLSKAADTGYFDRPEEFCAERVASFVVFLCGDQAATITNGDFIVGGGQVIMLSPVTQLGAVDWLAPDNVEKLQRLFHANQPD